MTQNKKTGYYLFDNPNGTPQKFISRKNYAPRKKGVKPNVIVIHTAENTPDRKPPDNGAEAIAEYFLRIRRAASAHCNTDSDSIVPLVPDSYMAWHVRGYNAKTLGIELCTQAGKWHELEAIAPDYVDQHLWMAARVVGNWCYKHDIPVTYLTKADVDRGHSGITGHHVLDPKRRTDPGSTFPWNRFLSLVQFRVDARKRRPIVMSDYEFYRKLEDDDVLVSKANGYIKYLEKKAAISQPTIVEPRQAVSPTVEVVPPLTPEEIKKLRRLISN